MIVILAIFSFILGAILASFGGVIIARIPNGESIVKPASHCSNCNNVLEENVDIVKLRLVIFILLLK